MSAPRFIVVDSDRAHAEACEAALLSLGYAVHCAEDADAGAAALSMPDVCGVVLDVPGLGDSAALRLAASDAGVPLLEMSAVVVGGPNRALGRELLGAADVFSKPVGAERIGAWARTQAAPVRDAAGTPHMSIAARDQTGESLVSREALPTPLVTDISPSEATPIAAGAAVAGATPVVASEPAPRAPSASWDRPAGLSRPQRLDAASFGVEGDFTNADACAVLLGVSEREGTLHIAGDRARYELIVAGGRVVGARSNAAEDRLSAVLADDGLVRADQLDAISRNLGVDAAEQLATYVEAGVLGAEDGAVVEDVVLRRRVENALLVDAGHWRFVPEPVAAEGRASGGAVALRAVYDAATHVLPTDRIRDALDASPSAPIAWITQPPSRSTLDVPGWQRALIGSIDGLTSAADLLRGAPDRDAGMALIFTLVAGGFVGFAAQR